MGAFADLLAEIDSRHEGEKITIRIRPDDGLEDVQHLTEYSTTLPGATYSYKGRRYGMSTSEGIFR